MSERSIEFGWGAPSFAEQLPQLSQFDAETADKFNQAIILLAVHGIITDGERDKAIKRATQKIGANLRKALRQEAQS